MKKQISILLLVLFGLNNIGVYPVLKLLQSHAKEVAGSIIERGHPEHLIVFKNIHENTDVIWEEKNREFSLRGNMYDIARQQTVNGVVLSYCYDDQKESEIFNKIMGFVSRQTHHDHNTAENSVLHLMTVLAQAFIPTEPFIFKPLFINGFRHTGSFCCAGGTSCIIEIPLPPPRPGDFS